jgi:hypothetical protein
MRLAQKPKTEATRIALLLAVTVLPPLGAQTNGQSAPLRFNLCLRINVPPDYEGLNINSALERQAKHNDLTLSDPNIVIKSESMCQASGPEESNVHTEVIFKDAGGEDFSMELTVGSIAWGRPTTITPKKPYPDTLPKHAQKRIDTLLEQDPLPVYQEFVRHWRMNLTLGCTAITSGGPCTILPLDYNRYHILAARQYSVTVPLNTGAGTKTLAETLDKCSPDGQLVLILDGTNVTSTQVPRPFKFRTSELTTLGPNNAPECNPLVKTPRLTAKAPPIK